MPPLRTIPSIKPIKTERTHEENQERAYIAASRRSDRSLEARVESARRASEIHKRRTGRSLRVTEQDVINEEMYEEEDDDLPMQYRRLTAHLNTNSSDFNRRLAAYLSNHVAMRTALDQAISSSYSEQQQNQTFPQNTNSLGSTGQVWPSGQNPQYPSQLSQHMAAHGLSPFRQTPYPLPATHGYRTSSASSCRSPADGAATRVEDAGDNSTEQAGRSASASQHGLTSPSVSAAKALCRDATGTPSADAYPLSISPLTTEIPPETRMFFAAGYGNNDSFGNSIFNGGDKQPLFAYDQGSRYNMPFLDGMSQTLAPTPGQDTTKWPGSRGGYQGGPAFDLESEARYNDENPFGSTTFGGEGGDMEQTPPGEQDWSCFIDTASWDET